jgi:hypothetical protein
MRFNRICLFLSLLSVACIGSAKPRALDAEGRPVFDASKLYHTPGDPYFCYSLVLGSGEEVTQCDVSRERCVRNMSDAKNSGAPILSGCRTADEVNCYILYTSGAMINSSQVFCGQSPHDCQVLNSVSVRDYGQDGVSACEHLDRNASSQSNETPSSDGTPEPGRNDTNE